MQQDIYMTTGEFARMMRVSKDTLFHYDKIGLLKPEIVKTNGYRYYSVYQADLLEAIFMLRDLGMPLKEIQEHLAQRHPHGDIHWSEAGLCRRTRCKGRLPRLSPPCR